MIYISAFFGVQYLANSARYLLVSLDEGRSLQNKDEYMRRIAVSQFWMLLPA
jgi:hypothetical protein